MSGAYRGRGRLYIRPTLRPDLGKLPWPMRLGEMVGFYAILLAIGLVGIVGGGWVGMLLFEPSAWRLLPIVVFFVLVRFVIARPLLRAISPPDVAERWIAFGAQGDPINEHERRGS